MVNWRVVSFMPVNTIIGHYQNGKIGNYNKASINMRIGISQPKVCNLFKNNWGFTWGSLK